MTVKLMPVRFEGGATQRTVAEHSTLPAIDSSTDREACVTLAAGIRGESKPSQWRRERHSKHEHSRLVLLRPLSGRNEGLLQERKKGETLQRLLKAFDELQLWSCQNRVADIEKALIPLCTARCPAFICCQPAAGKRKERK